MVSLRIHISHFLIELLSVLPFFVTVTSNCLSVLQFTGSDADMVYAIGFVVSLAEIYS